MMDQHRVALRVARGLALLGFGDASVLAASLAVVLGRERAFAQRVVAVA